MHLHYDIHNKHQHDLDFGICRLCIHWDRLVLKKVFSANFLRDFIFLDVEVDTIDPDQKPKVSKNFPPPIPEYSSQSLFIKHLFALEVKRFHHSKRNKKGMFCEVSKKIFLELSSLSVTLSLFRFSCQHCLYAWP